MKSASGVVRILQSIHGLAIVIGFCGVGICLEAQPNSWTSPVSGNWEDLTWSLGVRPAAGQDIFITNAGWKAVQLTYSTAVNFPGCMTVNSITLDAPPDTLNVLLLNYVDTSTPLTAGFMHTKSNTVVTLLSSALNVTFDMFEMNGTFNQGLFSAVTAKWLIIGDDGPGVYNLTNGTLSVTGIGETLGPAAGFPSVFNQEGGYHYAIPILIGAHGTYHLQGGQLGGAVTVAGGTLAQTGGDLSPDSLVVKGKGSLVQSGGTGSIGPTTVGEMSSFPNPQSSYTLSNGVPIFSSDLTIGSLGVFDQEGGSNTINGTLSVSSDDFRPDSPVQGIFSLNAGILSVRDISLSGVYNQGGGTNQVAGDLTITGVRYGRYNLTGGWLVTSNTEMLNGDGNFIQTGGRHQVSGTLHVTGGSEPAYGLDGGQLIAPTIEIAYGTFSHRGGTVTNMALLRLSGWWKEFAGNQQFGQLQMGATDGSLWLGTNSAILRFANSSGQPWGSGILHLRNWSGSLSGGGGNQVIFGNSSAGLTPAQVAQIRFDYFPSTQYPAKILPTGEVVPNPSGAPLVPDGLTAQGISANQINLAWTDNSLDETGFKIERSLDGTNFTQIATVVTNTTNYSDTGLSPVTAYFYRIRAYNDSGDSSYTSVAEASTKWSGPAPLPGMVAWWPGENSADDVLHDHNGTTPYGIAYAPGESGQAFDFDGSNRRVFVPDSSDFVPTNGFTFEGWFYARQTLDSYIGMRGDDRGGLDAWVVRRSINGQLTFQMDDMLNNFAAIEAPVQNNQWYHFAATFDRASGSLNLFLNGALAVQTNTTFQPIGAYDPGWNPGVGIGNQSGTITKTSFDGLIDDVALYSRALLPAEIQSIYNAGSAGKAGLAPAPLLSVKSQSGGGLQLTIGGVAGRVYEVQVSTNLMNWMTWTEVESTGTLSVIDTNTTAHPQRFYRARLLP
ncbi:MAG TPA: LamG-like jellyroll fold domain-containing protein [Candidatus Limnocylindrales bacterium]|nr:LamG-like jellyroll fold domain-containing protein [Candidatus Limnocylindrales bacterium]